MASRAGPGWRLAVFRGAIHSALAVTTQCLHGVRWNAASSSPFFCPSWCSIRTRRSSSNERRRRTQPRARRHLPRIRRLRPPPHRQRHPPYRDTPTSGATSLVGETVERDVRVETPNIVAVFTNRGARLKSWRLKHYRDNQGESLELVANDVAGQPLPFSLTLPDAATTASLNGGLYAVKGAPDAAAVLSAPTQIAFEYRDSSGLTSTKRFTLDPAGYTLIFEAAIAQNDRPLAPTIVWGPGLGDNDSQQVRSAVRPEALYSAAGKVTRLAGRGDRKAADPGPRFRIRRHRRSLLHGGRAQARRIEGDVPDARYSGRRRPESGAGAESGGLLARLAGRRPADDVLHRSQGFRHAGRGRSRSRRRRSTSACSRFSSCRCCDR